MVIMRCFHLSKNPSREDYFNKRMEEVYYPKKALSLDESMVLWRKMLSFRQFIKGKKHKYGIK